jgi:hypothetical protein
MKIIILKIITVCIMSLSLFGAGYYVRGGTNDVREIIVEKQVQNIVYRNVKNMKRPELEYELNQYHTSDFIIKWNKENRQRWNYRVTLHERWVDQYVLIPVNESDGWKFKVGFYAILALGAGYAGYKLLR